MLDLENEDPANFERKMSLLSSTYLRNSLRRNTDINKEMLQFQMEAKFKETFEKVFNLNRDRKLTSAEISEVGEVIQSDDDADRLGKL